MTHKLSVGPGHEA